MAADSPADSLRLNDAQDIFNRKVLDLTHVLKPGLPDFHEGGQSFTYKKIYSVDNDGYGNGFFSMVEHYGTHVDAPNHFFDGKASVDQLAAQDLVVPCVVIDVRDQVKNNPDYQLTLERVKSFERAGTIPARFAVLLLTGWDARWRTPADYRNADAKGGMHFPGFGAEACEYLIKQRHVAAIGIDTLSIDAGSNNDYSCHKIALGAGLYMMENLKDLALLPSRGALLFCGPLRIENGTGSPARIVAVTP
jgi:kynurenine formamidase